MNKRLTSIILVICLLISSLVSQVQTVNAFAPALPIVGITLEEFFINLGLSLGGSYVIKEAYEDYVDNGQGLFNSSTISSSSDLSSIANELINGASYSEWLTAGFFVSCTNSACEEYVGPVLVVDNCQPSATSGKPPNPNKDPREDEKWKKAKEVIKKYCNGIELGLDIKIFDSVMSAYTSGILFASHDADFSNWWGIRENGQLLTPYQYAIGISNYLGSYRYKDGTLLSDGNNYFENLVLALPNGFSDAKTYYEENFDSAWEEKGYSAKLYDNNFVYYNSTLSNYSSKYSELLVLPKGVGFSYHYGSSGNALNYIFPDLDYAFKVLLRADGFSSISLKQGSNFYYPPIIGEFFTNYSVDINGLKFGKPVNLFSVNGFKSNTLLQENTDIEPYSPYQITINNNNYNDWSYLRDEMLTAEDVAQIVKDNQSTESVSSIKFTNEAGEVLQNINSNSLSSNEDMGTDLLTSIKRLPQAIFDFFKNILNKIYNAIVNLYNFIITLPSTLHELAQLIIGSIISLPATINNNLKIALSNLADSIAGLFIPSQATIDSIKERANNVLFIKFGLDPDELNQLNVEAKPLPDIKYNDSVIFNGTLINPLIIKIRPYLGGVIDILIIFYAMSQILSIFDKKGVEE